MKGVTKKLVLAVFSLLFVAGTLFLETRMNASDLPGKDVVVAKGSLGASVDFENGTYRVKAGGEKLELVVKGNVVFRMDAKSQATVDFMPTGDGQRRINISLGDGMFWLNTVNSSMPVFLSTEQVHLEAYPGIFDIRYQDSSLALAAHRHYLGIEFLGNRLILPETRQMTIAEQKLTSSAETIKKLRYSKLLKEFPFFAAEKPDAWTLENLKSDEEFGQEYRKKIAQGIRDKGPVLPSDDASAVYKANESFKKMSRMLTFDATKKTKRDVEHIFDFFDAAVYALSIGKTSVADFWFGQFTGSIQNSETLKGRKEFSQATSSRFDTLAYVQPTESLFEAKTVLREASPSQGLDSLRLAFYDVLDTAAAGSDAETEQRVLTSLRRFGSKAQAERGGLANPNEGERVFFMSVVLNDFFARKPLLLREEFLRIAEIFERAHLDSIAGREEADDQRQFFIAEKLRRIQTLRELMEKGDMPFQDARRSILLIANEIEALKPTFSDTAVLAYFQKQLDEMGPLIAFLRSSTADNVRGSFEDSFKEFQESVDEYKKVNALLEDAEGGDQISPFRREELAGMVAKDFGTVGIANIKIVLPETEGDARVNVVSAEIEGKPFTASYDTSRKIFSDIVLDSEKISNSIRLENFQKFVQVKLGKLVLPTGTSADSLVEAPSQGSALEKVAKSALIGELTKLNVTVEEKYIGVENLREDILHVRLALIGEGIEAKVFSFDVSQKGSVVSNLKVQTVSGEIPVNDTFALRELPTRVAQIYERALFEKQKEEEMKKFAEEGELSELPPLPEEIPVE